MKNSFSLKGGLVIGTLLLTTLSRAGDQWTYFHPESVRSYGCNTVERVIVQNGVAQGEVVWIAEGHAVREHDAWEFEIGRFPHTRKGRHKAEKACSKWQDKAEDKVREAQDNK